MGENAPDVPDSIRPYLNEISERLWAERAVVMVGAGFSKNAGDGFPDWNQLGDLLYRKAHGVTPDPTQQKYQNVLRLAEEVQAAIGRPALENLIRSSIPDLEIEPSSLHTTLLELPWVDVFTTNYDTLLERASAKIVTRRYEPVVNNEDIPYAIKPRIIKLHGSFPSTRPFIITEEDYRRYPHDYAPFVNTVQQALLENTLCLIGFSGDDPNFLQWIGWIRDNLGKDKTQKIYLIGAFALSSARQQLLTQRGIIVVDLSCCDGIEKYDHKKAMEYFFDFINSKKPDDLNWPPKSTTMPPQRDEGHIEAIQMITKEWRLQRQKYPGWLILPYINRKILWENTNTWVHILPGKETSLPGLDIQYAFELIWRLERCLLPVFENIAGYCERLLEKYWPFQNSDPPANCQIHIANETYQDLPWSEIQQAWLAIAMAMLRYYREEGDQDTWNEAQTRLGKLSEHLAPEQVEFLNYERFLFSLFTINLTSARHCLEKWRPSEAQPYWIVKRAAALAELGLLSEAGVYVKEGLESIRRKQNQKRESKNISLISQESNAMLSGQYFQAALDLKTGEYGSTVEKNHEDSDRWNEWKMYKCDPSNELQLFELMLNRPLVERKNYSEKREFDIGSVTTINHLLGSDTEALNAYAFLRFCEEVGLPYRVGIVTISTKTAMESVKRIARYSSFWANATLIRLGSANAVDNLYSREAVRKFTIQFADQMIDGYLNALSRSRDAIQTGDPVLAQSFDERLALLLPEVISRLCCKCSREAKHRVLEFVSEIYASPRKGKYRHIKELLRRLIDSMSEMEQYELIPELLKINYPENINAVFEDEYSNPFLRLGIQGKSERWRVLSLDEGIMNRLIQQAESQGPGHRRWAITTLATLYGLQLLNEIQVQGFANALWRDPDKMPEGTDYCQFAFLNLPCPDEVDPVTLFKRSVKSMSFPIQGEDARTYILASGIGKVYEIIGSNSINESIWTEDDAIEIMPQLLEWWDADKGKLKKNDLKDVMSIRTEFSSRFMQMANLIAEVVGPRISAALPEEVRASLSRLLQELREYGVPGLVAEAACLHAFPDQKQDVYARIHDALVSGQDNVRKDALKALEKIIQNKNNIDWSLTEPDPVMLLCQYVAWCPLQSVEDALRIVTRILKNAPSEHVLSLESASLRRLAGLLAETAYDHETSHVSFDEKLEIRRYAAILAATLWASYSSRGTQVPGIIEQWRIECLHPDEFAEIRNAWVDCAG